MNSTTYPEIYRAHVELVPEQNVYELLQISLKDLLKRLIMTSNARAEESYETGKWNIKEMLQHLMDTERIFCYRALAIARGDTQALLSFDHDAYAKTVNPNGRKLRDIMDELKRLRATTIDLFKSFDRAALERSGVVGGNELMVKQILIVLIGHEMHHLKVLEEKYF